MIISPYIKTILISELSRKSGNIARLGKLDSIPEDLCRISPAVQLFREIEVDIVLSRTPRSSAQSTLLSTGF